MKKYISLIVCLLVSCMISVVTYIININNNIPLWLVTMPVWLYVLLYLLISKRLNTINKKSN